MDSTVTRPIAPSLWSGVLSERKKCNSGSSAEPSSSMMPSRAPVMLGLEPTADMHTSPVPQYAGEILMGKLPAIDVPQANAGDAKLPDDHYDCYKDRPFLRGKIHLVLICLSPIWIVLLLEQCSTWNAAVAALISVISSFTNFCASMLLHNFSWSPTAHKIMERIDHAGIFMMISGSTTPIPMLLLEKGTSMCLMIVQWSATIYGIVSIIFGDLSTSARQRRSVIYIIVGLLHALFITEYFRVLTGFEMTLVVCLAVLYIVGAVIYAKRRPDPFPNVFGFHEIFHVCCLGSAVCTFYLDYSILVRAGGNSHDSLVSY